MTDLDVCALKQFDFIRLCFVDLNGMHLSKLVSSRHADKIVGSKCELCTGMITFGPRMQEVKIPAIVARKHVNGILRPDMTTLHACSWTDRRESKHSPVNNESSKNVDNFRVGTVMCDLCWPEGDPLSTHPRVVTAKLLERLQSRHGLRLMSAFEPEFRAFELETLEPSCRPPESAEDGSWPEPIPFTTGEDMYRTSLLAIYEPFFMDLSSKMEKIGVDIQDCSNENAAGQLECPLMPEFGLDAADHYFTLKQAAKEIGREHGMGVSFMTAPLLQGVSSGCHYNHSLWFADGRNAFYDVKDADKLSTLARHWIGGLMAHLPAMLALCSPTVNCYRRLHKNLAPDAVNWDINDRFVSLRVKNVDEKRTYMENRIPSSASCPYHVMAATLAAGMDGLERKLEPPIPGQKPVDRRETPSCKLLPHTFREALAVMKGDTHFTESIGEDFVDWFIQVKENADLEALGHVDVSKACEKDLAEERFQYLVYI